MLKQLSFLCLWCISIQAFSQTDSTIVSLQNFSSVATPKGYSHAAIIDMGKSNMIILSGQVPIDKNGNLVGKNDFTKQAEQVFENIKNIMTELGGTMSNVIKIGIYLVNMKDIQALRNVRDKYIDLKNPPTSTLVEVSKLYREDVLLEVEATAVIPTQNIKIEKMKTTGYSNTNGIKMYYEIYGQGKPLVLLHGGGSTIESSFGRVIPHLTKHHQLICVELQAHGRTEDRNSPISFEQDAADVVSLLDNLKIEKADFFGFSNGGMTALKIGIKYPERCNKIIASSVLLKRNGTFPQFWEFMKKGSFEQMPQQYKDAFLKVNPDSTKLLNMFHQCANRMINFTDYSDDEIKSIKAPVLLINGDQDVGTNEHIAAMAKLIPDCRLAIFPGGHGAYIGEITTLGSDFKIEESALPVIEKFLSEFRN